MSRWCKDCGTKLSHRNSKRKRMGIYKDRGVCQPCFNSPSDKERCSATTTAGNRCKHRKIEESEKGYCAFHNKRSE